MQIIDDSTPLPLPPGEGTLADLNRFRAGLYRCLTRRGDTLFELADAIGCATGNVTDLARLSLQSEHRRGHGSLYDGLNAGQISTTGMRGLLADTPLPTMAGPDGRERIVLAVDVSNWLRPDAATSPDRAFCHTYARGHGQAQMIPGWQYSFVAALEPGPTSWTALLDATRLLPGDDATAVTATQLRRVLTELQRAGHHDQDDPEVLVVADAGYDGPRLAWLLADLPVTILCRVRSDRVCYAPAGTRAGPTKGRQPRHGARLKLRDRATHPVPTVATVNDTDRYGRAEATAFARMHPKIDTRGSRSPSPRPS